MFAKFTHEERSTARIIMDRAAHELNQDPTNTLMNLSAVHCHTPLRLHALAEADKFNFAHDILGIERHINKTTGELEDCFLPRFADNDDGESEK